MNEQDAKDFLLSVNYTELASFGAHWSVTPDGALSLSDVTISVLRNDEVVCRLHADGPFRINPAAFELQVEKPKASAPAEPVEEELDAKPPKEAFTTPKPNTVSVGAKPKAKKESE